MTIKKLVTLLFASWLTTTSTLQTTQTPDSDLTQKLTAATTFITLYLSKNLQEKTPNQPLDPTLLNKLNTHHPNQLNHQELQTLETHIRQQHTQLDYIRRSQDSQKRTQAETHQTNLQHIYKQIPPHHYLQRIENTLQQNLSTYFHQLHTLPEDFLQHGGQSIIDPQYNDPTFLGLAPALRKKAVQLMAQKIQNTPQQDLTTHLHHLHEQIHQELQQNSTDQLYNLRNTLQQLINQDPSTQTHDQEEAQDSDDDTDDHTPHNPDQVHVKIGKYIPPQQKKPTATTIDQAQQLAQIYTQFMQQDGIYATPQEGALLATHYGMHFSTQTNKDPYNSDLPLPYEIKLQHSGNGILAHFDIFGCTTGDGNCLFNAFAQQLAHHYIQEKHKKPNGRTAQHTLARLALKNLYTFTNPTNTHPTENTPSPPTTPNLNPDTSHVQKTITTNQPTDHSDNASDTERENSVTTEIDNYEEYPTSDDSSLSDTTIPQVDQLPIPLDLPHLNPDHQARIKARLQLASTPELPTIIQLLNQKLAPLQDKQLCENIGHYLAEIGHFYLHILQEKQPKDWVITSLKLDIIRTNIEEKDTLSLNLFEQTLHQYQAIQTPEQLLKKLYTVHQYIYNPEDPCTLYDLTTLLKYFIQNPHTKVTWEKTITPTLHAIQKEHIKQTINQNLQLPTFTKNQIIQLLYNITKPKQNQKWTNTLIHDLLNTITQEKKPQTILHFLNLIHQHHITPHTLQKILQHAKTHHLAALNDHQKALYHQLLQEKLNLILPKNILETAQQRINPTLWQLLAQIDHKNATQLFNLCYHQPHHLENLYSTLCLLTDYNPSTLTYQALADILLQNSPHQWENLTHQHLTKNTFSNPHEFTPQEILHHIQQSAQTENTPINTQDLNTTYQDIHTQLHKNRLPPQPIHPKIDQYYQQAQQSQKQETPLHIACRKNDLESVQQLIEKHNVNINPTDKNGNTPLHIACIKGYQEIIQYLVENGANINSKNKQEDTPLQSARRHNRNQTITYLNNLPKPIPQRITQYTEQSQQEGYRTLDHACMNGDLQAIKHLIENQHIDPHQTDQNASNALHFACCRKGTLDIVKYLVEKQHINPAQANKLGLNPLHYACRDNRLLIVQYLVEKTNPTPQQINKVLDTAQKNNHQNIVDYLQNQIAIQQRIIQYENQTQNDKEKNAPLHIASQNGDLDAIKDLIKNSGADPYETNKYLEIPLHLACWKGHLNIVQYFVENLNIDLNTLSTFDTNPLHYAAQNGYLDIVQYLIENTDIDLNKTSKQNKLPIDFAQENNHQHIITYLNNLPKPIPQRITQYTEQSQQEGYRTLDHACMNGDLQAVQHLIQNQHTDPHQTDQNGSNALHFACCRKGTLDIVKYLVEKQHINPAQANKLGLNPLHYACRDNRLHIAQYLIENTTINTQQKSKSGKTLLDLAQENKHQKLITYLTHRLQTLEKRITHYTHQSKNNPNGDTPLHLASRQSDLTAIKHFIQNQHTNPNITNYDNDTPLHYAVLNNDLQTVQYLIENGANIQAQNIDGNTPLQLAQRKNYIQITNYLENPPNTIAQWSEKHIQQWAQNYKIDPKPTLSETIAVITRAVQLHASYTPRPVQILTLLTLYHGVQSNNLKGRLAQVMTGEGKSITIAMLAILHALENHTIDIITTSTELSKREVQEKASLFALFNITVAENGPRENLPDHQQNLRLKLIKYLTDLFGNQYHQNPYQSQIIYGTPHNFQADILRTEFYGQKEVRTNRTFDIVIVDEVDSLFVDDRKHSTYLADPTPGMDLLQIPLAAVWHHVSNITKHIYTNPQGQHYHIEPDFEVNGNNLTLHTHQPFETCSTLIEQDKDEFIQKLALNILQDLLRNPTAEEKQAWEELQNLEDQINTHHDELIALKNQEEPDEQALTQKKQQIKNLETQRLQTPWYQKKYTTYLELPDYLRDHIHNELPQWIQNALHAQNYFTKEQEYDIVANKIIPIDHANTGVLQHNLVWSHGLSQFLSIKENLPLAPENLTTNYMSNVTLFTRYNTLYGLSGTLGSKASKNFLCETYQIDTLTLPPHKKRTIQGNTNSHLPCKVLTPYLCNKEDYTHTILQSICKQIRLGRSILIICPYISQVNTIADLLQPLTQHLGIQNITTYTGQTQFTKKKVDVGEIIIATNIAGRGTDLATTPALEKNGGLHVCIIGNCLPKNERVEAQAQGRTARSGKLGTSQLIIYDPTAQSIEQLKTQRAQREVEAMQKATADVTHIRFKDQIFKDFCNLLNNYLKLDSQTYYKRLNPELNNDTNYPSYPCPNWGPPIRLSLQEQFGLWLCSIETLLEKEDYPTVQQKFQTLKNNIIENTTRNYNPAKNPYYYVLEGNLHIRRALKQKEPEKSLYQQALYYYNQAISQDPILALHAHYNKAYALFYLEEKPEEAASSLKQAKKTLTDYYKPNLFILHHLITQKGNKKTISAQVQRQLNLLLLVDQYIDNALATIEQVKENNKQIIGIYKHVVAIDTHQPIEDIIQNRSHQTHTKPIAEKEDIEQFKLGGITHLFTLKEVIPQATVVTLAIISVSEIVVGGIIIVYSGGAASQIGYTLIQEGISDTIQTFKAAHNRQFDWKEWGIQKGITLTVGIATAGMKHGLSNVGADLKDIGKNVFKDIKTWKNIGLTQETQALKTLCQQTIYHHFKKGIAKECVNTLVDYRIEQILHNHLETIIAQAIHNTLTHALENNSTLQKALELDRTRHTNYWQDYFLHQGTHILQGNWSGWKKFLHNTLQGKTNPDQASKILNTPHIHSFLKQLGIAYIDDESASTVVKIFEGLLGTRDCLDLTQDFLQEFDQKIQQQAPIINRNYEETQKAQTRLQATQNDTVTTQQKTPYYQNPTHTTPQPIHITTPPTPQKNTQPIPHRTQEKKDESDNDEEPATLQETLPNTYIPSDIKELQNTFKNTLAERITKTIHQKGIKPFTSHYVNKGIDKLVEKSQEQLKAALAKRKLRQNPPHDSDPDNSDDSDHIDPNQQPNNNHQHQPNPYLEKTPEQLIQTADKLLESATKDPEEHKEERNKLLAALEEKRDNLKKDISGWQFLLEGPHCDDPYYNQKLKQAQQQEKHLYENYIKPLRQLEGRNNSPGAIAELGLMARGLGQSGVDGIKGLANAVAHPIETAENLGKAISKIPDALDYIASEIQEQLNNPEEYQRKQAIKRRQALDAYYAQDPYTRKANQARQAGYLVGEVIQLFCGPTEIIKGVSKLSKLPKLLGKGKIVNTLAKAGIAEEKIAKFNRIAKIPDPIKKTQAFNKFISKEKQIEKTLQKARLLPKLSKNTHKLSKASKTSKVSKANKLNKASKAENLGKAGESIKLPKTNKIYKRPPNANTRAMKKSVQGKPCSTCGKKANKMVADHKYPLVKEHYQTGTINKNRMRSLDAIQPQCPPCSNKQGGKLSKYSKDMKKLIKANNHE